MINEVSEELSVHSVDTPIEELLDETKLSFLESIRERYDKNTYQLYVNVLTKLQFLEGKLGKSIYDFAPDELQRALTRDRRGASVKTINMTCSVLTRFFDEIRGDETMILSLQKAKQDLLIGSDPIRRLYVKDYEHLYNYILRYLPYIVQQNPFYLMIVLFSYFGLEMKTMMSLKPKNVDFVNNRIIGEHGEIILENIPHSFMSVIHKSLTIDYVYSGFTKYPLYDCEYLIKKIDKCNTKTNGRIATDQWYISRAMEFFNGIENWDFIEETPIHFSHANLKKAGQFYKVYMYELINEPIGYVSQRQYNKIFLQILGVRKNHGANFYLEYENWRDTYYKI